MQADKQVATTGWRFDNSYLNLPDIFFTRIRPTPVRAPSLVLANQELAATLGLSDLMAKDDVLPILAGNDLPTDCQPFAQAYAGHQFGGFSILGDGRAVVLGEYLAPNGQRVDLQLKGSGPTPYSRRGDGRAALAPMLREYLMGEAMFGLGIPTTRALAVVATGEPVFRETALPGAVLTRVASSHLRVGTFQYAAAKGDLSALKSLVMYAIYRHYPNLIGSENPALALLRQVVDAQAALIVQWMRVGFIHGVMNTDNMTISGETIDYGPCAFMDSYDPATVFSSIDYQGRYAFGNQPGIAQWNLLRFAESLLPVLHRDEDKAVEMAKGAVGEFADLYTQRYNLMMLHKIGVHSLHDQDDVALVSDLLQWMQAQKVDYTNTFVDLSEPARLQTGIYVDAEFQQWMQRRQRRLGQQEQDLDSVKRLMQATNPIYIPRNHLVENALRRAEKDQDLADFNDLLAVLKTPYTWQPDTQEFRQPGRDDGSYQTFCGT